MEILIVGVFVVALMVYVSTRIKKSAARAYEREIVETDSFKVVKPEGFIIPINEESEYEFEAYSKEYGDEDARNIRQVSATIKSFSDSKFNDFCKKAKKSFDKIQSENFLTVNGKDKDFCLYQGEKKKDKNSYNVYQKILESSDWQKFYNLEVECLEENYEQFSDKINEIVDSFELK